MRPSISIALPQFGVEMVDDRKRFTSSVSISAIIVYGDFRAYSATFHSQSTKIYTRPFSNVCLACSVLLLFNVEGECQIQKKYEQKLRYWFHFRTERRSTFVTIFKLDYFMNIFSVYLVICAFVYETNTNFLKTNGMWRLFESSHQSLKFFFIFFLLNCQYRQYFLYAKCSRKSVIILSKKTSMKINTGGIFSTI